MKKIDKKTLILLILGVIAIIILIILFLGRFIKNEKNSSGIDNNDRLTGVSVSHDLIDDPDRVVVNNIFDDQVGCVNHICVEELSITCYENEGLINFGLFTKGSSNIEAGYIKLVINEQPIIIYHDVIKPNVSTKGFFTYDGYDFRNITSYKLEKLDISDYETIVN